MHRTSFADMSCSIARTLEVAGEWWTPLILRDVYLGIDRFDDLQRDLGIARKVLAQRLDHLAAHGILQRRPYQQHPVRHRYLLGHDLVPVLFALMAWGDRWAAGPDGPPMRLRHHHCGQRTTPQVTCATCGQPLALEEVTVEAGPGGHAGPGTQVIAERLQPRTGKGATTSARPTTAAGPPGRER
jgi:DNA-binding HxlR family transcriptional regulator